MQVTEKTTEDIYDYFYYSVLKTTTYIMLFTHFIHHY